MAKKNSKQALEEINAAVASRVQVQLLQDAQYKGAHYGIGRVIRVAAETAKAWIADGTAAATESPEAAGGVENAPVQGKK